MNIYPWHFKASWWRSTGVIWCHCTALYDKWHYMRSYDIIWHYTNITTIYVMIKYLRLFAWMISLAGYHITLYDIMWYYMMSQMKFSFGYYDIICCHIQHSIIIWRVCSCNLCDVIMLHHMAVQLAFCNILWCVTGFAF